MTQANRLPIVIAGVMIAGFGASIWMSVSRHQAHEKDIQTLQTEVTQLQNERKQIAASRRKKSSSPVTTSAATADVPDVAGASSISIGIYGVRLTGTDPIMDLTFATMSSGGMTVAGLTTQSLLAKYPGCKPGIALGTLVRRPQSQKAPFHNKLIKTIGSYSYYHVPSRSACADDQAGRDALAAARAALVNSVLPTLTK